MTSDHDAHPTRLSPELQAEYQQTFNDPAKRGSADWHRAGQALADAGLIGRDALGETERNDAVRQLNEEGSS